MRSRRNAVVTRDGLHGCWDARGEPNCSLTLSAEHWGSALLYQGPRRWRRLAQQRPRSVVAL